MRWRSTSRGKKCRRDSSAHRLMWWRTWLALRDKGDRIKMIDVKKTRARIAQLEAEWSGGISFGAERSEICTGYLAALDEIEAMRKPAPTGDAIEAAAIAMWRDAKGIHPSTPVVGWGPAHRDDREHYTGKATMILAAAASVAPAKPVASRRFDVPAARVEMARIDAAWGNCGKSASASVAYHDARAMLDKALAAIDAGWPEPAGDVVERGAKAAHVAEYPCEEWTDLDPHAQREYITTARAVLRSAGRLPPVAPMAITPEVVEEAACRLWCSPTSGGIRGTVDGWNFKCDEDKQTTRNEARAVLEYAASVGLVAAPAKPAGSDCDCRGACSCHVSKASETACLDDYGSGCGHSDPTPAGKCAAGRIDRCRDRAARYVAERGVPESWDATDIAQEIESYAHAMLAAERSPT